MYANTASSKLNLVSVLLFSQLVNSADSGSVPSETKYFLLEETAKKWRKQNEFRCNENHQIRQISGYNNKGTKDYFIKNNNVCKKVLITIL